MPKTLKDFLEVYKPKSPDEQKFVDKHVVIKHKDRNGNGDDVFNAAKIKTGKRKEERHGYDAGEDEKVYEALKGDQHKIDANKNGKVDAHDFHLLRKKKKVAEETEELDELSTEKLLAYRKKAREADTNKHHVYADEADKKIKKKTGVYNPNLLQRAKAKLRNEETEENEEVDLGEAVTVNKKNYSWGKMVTVHQGASTTYPLHPEHQEKIRKLSDGDKTSFKDETGATVHAHRSGDTVHLKKPGSSNRTTAVAHSHFTEEVNLQDLLDEALELLSAVTEGAMPTADEPTDANKKTAQRIRDLLAKEKKPVKEETEDLDEMSSYEVTGEHTDGHLKTLSYFAKSPAHAKSQFHAKQSKKDYTVKTVKKLAESTELDESAKIAAHLIKRYGDNVRKSHVVSAANDFGVDASKLAKAVRTKLGKTSLAEEDDGWYTHSQIHGSMKSEKHPKGISAAEWKSGIRWHHGKNKRINIKEDVEEIDELSKDTMLKYLSANKKSGARGGPDTIKRMRGADMAVRKYTARDNKYVRVPATEEVEQVDELSNKTLQGYMSKATSAKSAMTTPTDKLDKRYKGVMTAQGKMDKRNMATEEVEELDELSKATMGSYINKAAERIGTKGVSAGLRIAADEKSSKNFKDMGKRQKGIARAVGKLTKEDIINRAVAKYVPEDLKFTPEERLLKRLNGLSEAHINTMLGLFEDLNKDNQNKMIETVSTEDGINQILNFVLENRGK